ncbi:MAG TPA: hypothetical protein VFB22_05895 [Candidatus Baltobacteraceae bacterium]|nr:hypothetical protein [Candidatus Baltobacteraceae bacterium]
MKVEFAAHPEQAIHGENHLRSNEIDWPDDIPIPAVGDRVYLYGAEVVIVDRLLHTTRLRAAVSTDPSS